MAGNPEHLFELLRWNVRGGKWCQLLMSEPPAEIKPKEPPTLLQKKSRKFETTNEKSKFYSSSKKYSYKQEESSEEEEYEEQNEQDNACFRCGRSSHWARDCFAKTDIDGNWID